jgi:hypothetical protein
VPRVEEASITRLRVKETSAAMLRPAMASQMHEEGVATAGRL